MANQLFDSKVVGYAVVGSPDPMTAAKIVGYVAQGPQDATLNVAKCVAYVVVGPLTRWTVSCETKRD